MVYVAAREIAAMTSRLVKLEKEKNKHKKCMKLAQPTHWVLINRHDNSWHDLIMMHASCAAACARLPQATPKATATHQRPVAIFRHLAGTYSDACVFNNICVCVWLRVCVAYKFQNSELINKISGLPAAASLSLAQTQLSRKWF